MKWIGQFGAEDWEPSSTQHGGSNVCQFSWMWFCKINVEYMLIYESLLSKYASFKLKNRRNVLRMCLLIVHMKMGGIFCGIRALPLVTLFPRSHSYIFWFNSTVMLISMFFKRRLSIYKKTYRGFSVGSRCSGMRNTMNVLCSPRNNTALLSVFFVWARPQDMLLIFIWIG